MDWIEISFFRHLAWELQQQQHYNKNNNITTTTLQEQQHCNNNSITRTTLQQKHCKNNITRTTLQQQHYKNNVTTTSSKSSKSSKSPKSLKSLKSSKSWKILKILKIIKILKTTTTTTTTTTFYNNNSFFPLFSLPLSLIISLYTAAMYSLLKRPPTKPGRGPHRQGSRVQPWREPKLPPSISWQITGNGGVKLKFSERWSPPPTLHHVVLL